MTKHRPPLSLGAALARIAGQIEGDWKAMAAICGRDVSTVYAWDAPNQPYSIPMDCACRLDIAFQAAGGVGAPIHEVYTLRLEEARVTRFADQLELAHQLLDVMREGSEAEQALVIATLPGATPAALAHARQQVEESVTALTATLAHLPPRPT